MSTAKKGAVAKKSVARKIKPPPLPELRVAVSLSLANGALSVPDIYVAMPLTIVFYFDTGSLPHATFDGLPQGTRAFEFSGQLPTAGEFGTPSVGNSGTEVHVQNNHTKIMTRSFVLKANYNGKAYTTLPSSSSGSIRPLGGGNGVIINK